MSSHLMALAIRVRLRPQRRLTAEGRRGLGLFDRRWPSAGTSWADRDGGPGPASNNAMTPPPPLTRPGGPTGPATYGGGATQQLLEVEATDEGKVVAHHGDGNTYGLSVYDPSTNGWSRIPSPPADYIDKDGTRVHLGEEAFAWGNLEVGNEGEIYVVWRTSEEASVRDYEQSQNPGVVGGGPRL
ncbi:MAG TPA: hypothetical protein EYO33_05280, partial [Phycisphaerales bacterium]|nr:hypothetical protein [Phycisphaerales bacterium]